MRTALLLLALTLPLAACGGSGSSSSTAQPPAPTSPPTVPGSTSLRVSVRANRNAALIDHTVTCPGDDVCDRLEALPITVFEPVPSNVACSDIYGGPQEASVQGTLSGRQIDAAFNRSNGCESARWAKIAFLLKNG